MVPFIARQSTTAAEKGPLAIDAPWRCHHFREIWRTGNAAGRWPTDSPSLATTWGESEGVICQAVRTLIGSPNGQPAAAMRTSWRPVVPKRKRWVWLERETPRPAGGDVRKNAEQIARTLRETRGSALATGHGSPSNRPGPATPSCASWWRRRLHLTEGRVPPPWGGSQAAGDLVTTHGPRVVLTPENPRTVAGVVQPRTGCVLRPKLTSTPSPVNRGVRVGVASFDFPSLPSRPRSAATSAAVAVNEDSMPPNVGAASRSRGVSRSRWASVTSAWRPGATVWKMPAHLPQQFVVAVAGGQQAAAGSKADHPGRRAIRLDRAANSFAEDTTRSMAANNSAARIGLTR